MCQINKNALKYTDIGFRSVLVVAHVEKSSS